MGLSTQDIIDRLREPTCGVCRHVFGPVSFLDEEEYERLGSAFADAVTQFTTSDGAPIQPTPLFPGLDVERAAFWQRPTGILYVLLWWGDNTRYRGLNLGIARRESLKWS